MIFARPKLFEPNRSNVNSPNTASKQCECLLSIERFEQRANPKQSRRLHESHFQQVELIKPACFFDFSSTHTISTSVKFKRPRKSEKWIFNVDFSRNGFRFGIILNDFRSSSIRDTQIVFSITLIEILKNPGIQPKHVEMSKKFK